MSKRRAREMTKGEVEAINAEYDRAHGIVQHWWNGFGSAAEASIVIALGVAAIIGLPVLTWVYWSQIVDLATLSLGLVGLILAWGFWKSLFL